MTWRLVWAAALPRWCPDASVATVYGEERPRRDEPASPRLHQDVVEEIQQMALHRYSGLPHWGKNQNAVFMAVKRVYDPDVVRCLGSVVMVVVCVSVGLCVCSQDSNCAPEKGYLCQPRMVYKEARVCRHVDDL
ncbi:hypothetical protein HU200_048904 [Digitaria exilis]|uniref:L-gulonolactone oxidase 2-like C-terminal domain-containing protein n=1 Tax=Digitaria exilis TaxID=1010633 RepID=A0A835EAH2_9POAL|nr:hypothetical protein HU200_048904 [Digitaria exilis]